jgi:hypothetical protein
MTAIDASWLITFAAIARTSQVVVVENWVVEIRRTTKQP